VSSIKKNRLTFCGEKISVYCDYHAEHINTLSGQSADFINATPIGAFVEHWVLTFWPLKWIYITRVGTLIVATIYLQLIQN